LAFELFILEIFMVSFGRDSVKRSPNNQMLGRRQKIDSKVLTSSSMYINSVYSLLKFQEHKILFLFFLLDCENFMRTLSLNFQAGPYSWLTYKEVYDVSIQMGSAMRSRGINPVSFQ